MLIERGRQRRGRRGQFVGRPTVFVDRCRQLGHRLGATLLACLGKCADFGGRPADPPAADGCELGGSKRIADRRPSAGVERGPSGLGLGLLRRVCSDPLADDLRDTLWIGLGEVRGEGVGLVDGHLSIQSTDCPRGR